MSQKVFPFIPQHTDWQTFNGNLIMYYGQEAIPIAHEDDWHLTANSINQSASFSTYGIPDSDKFDNWEDWANNFALLINGPPIK
jgi:hypothetical protein